MIDNSIITNGEKLYHAAAGLETGGKSFVINGESAQKVMQRDAENKFNDSVKDKIEKLNKYEDMVKSCQKEVGKDMANLQIKPILNYVIVKPYANNPFQQMQTTQSGIITDLGGYAPEYKSNETGEYEEEKSLVRTGLIIEVGGECKYAKVGDTCFWWQPSERPIPFFKQGFILVNENQLMALVNDDLETRECYNKKS